MENMRRTTMEVTSEQLDRMIKQGSRIIGMCSVPNTDKYLVVFNRW